MNSKLLPTIVSAGCDWISVTQSDKEKVDSLREIAFALADVELSLDMFGKPWSVSGYEGFHVGEVEYGERFDGCLLRLHGDLAHAHWQRVFTLSRNVTRFDTEVTFRVDRDVRLIVRRHLRQLQREKRKHKKWPKVEYKVSDNDGMTVYSGRRQSDQYGRCYDKEREALSERWNGCIRFEKETKGKKCFSLASRFLSAKEQSTAMALHTLGFFRDRGCLVAPYLEVFQSPRIIIHAEGSARLTDVDRISRWLQKSVGPSFRAIVERRGEAFALALMGLS